MSKYTMHNLLSAIFAPFKKLSYWQGSNLMSFYFDIFTLLVMKTRYPLAKIFQYTPGRDCTSHANVIANKNHQDSLNKPGMELHDWHEVVLRRHRTLIWNDEITTEKYT